MAFSSIGRIGGMVGKNQDNASSKKNKAPDLLAVTATASDRALLLVQFWQAERVRKMREISLGSDFLHPVVLELHAKASYIVLKEEGRRAEPTEVRHFIDCWLSFLFHPDLFRSLSGKRGSAEQQRLECLDLLEAGEKMVRKYAEQQGEGGEQFIRHWEEDVALLKILSNLVGEGREIPLYTPSLAWQAGIVADIFAHFFRKTQGGQEAFVDQEGFLAAGALYSGVGPALLLVRKGQYDAAKNELAALRKKSGEKNSDSFFAYGLAQVKIACGLDALEQGHYEEAEEMLIELLPLPLHSSGLEQELLAALDQEDRYLNVDELIVCVHVLTSLHKHSSTKAVKKAFCSVLTHQAVLLHNEGVLDGKGLLTSMEKAVSLNPDDEFARMAFDDAQMDAEILALHQTMSAGKLAEASRIAKKSSYQGVADQFFIFAAQVMEQVETEDYPDDESAFFMIRQLLEGALQVDSKHRMVQEIALLLDKLEDRLETL
ncbi:Tetratricopeptide repeat-containing protein [Candidatus Electrothrix laxa]